MSKGYTDIITDKMNDWGLDKIYEIEDHISELEEKVPEIISYLNDIHYSMPMGLALRRFICEKYSVFYDVTSQEYRFSFDSKDIVTKDYRIYVDGNYDIKNDEIQEYTELFNTINSKYNTSADGKLLLEIPKAEVRRQLRASSGCLRKKMILLSFALHMNNEETSKFLTDVLAEQTFNYREPNEIIALFCQSHDEFNSYEQYLELVNLYQEKSKNTIIKEKEKNYTAYAREKVNKEIHTKEELIDFLLSNVSNFYAFSETTYNEFVFLYKSASNFLISSKSELDLNEKTREERSKIIKEAIANNTLINPEQLAKEMLACIPRATIKKIKNGKKIVNNDFINIYNGEKGQDETKVKTTDLPKKITMNLPISDRLWDLLRRDKAVERKDLVFMKFYVFSKYLEKQEPYSSDDYFVFMDECNSMLVRCGMSRLYPGNRFENLVMLSLLASNPYEMFENIIEYSFMNEPSSESEEE